MSIAHLNNECISCKHLPEDYLAEIPANQHIVFRTLYPFFDDSGENLVRRTQEEARSNGYLYPATPQKLDISTLSPQQLSALTTILETDLVWMQRSNFPEIFGLPPERSKIRELIKAQAKNLTSDTN